MSLPTTFYPQANPSANFNGGGGLAPLQSGAAIRSAPTIQFAPMTPGASNVLPQGDYSVGQGLALGQAIAQPFASIANTVSNFIDPVKIAQRKATLLGLQNQIGQEQETGTEQPLTNVISRQLLHNRASFSGANPEAIQQAEPSLFTGGGNTNTNPTGMSSTGSAPSSGLNQTLSGVSASVPTSNATSNGAPAGQGYDAKGYGLPPNPPAISGSDATMGAALGKTPPTPFLTDRITGMPTDKINPDYARYFTQVEAAQKQLRQDNKLKGMTNADYAPYEEQKAFTQTHPGTYNADVDKIVRSYPALLDAENQLVNSLADPNLAPSDTTVQGHKLADLRGWLPTWMPGSLPPQRAVALNNFDVAKTNVQGKLADVLSHGRGLTRADQPLSALLTGGGLTSASMGKQNVQQLKQRIGDQLGQTENSLQDMSREGHYVSPEAEKIILSGSNTLNSRLSNVPNSQTDTSDIFSSKFQNPGMTQQSPSAPKPSGTFTDTQKAQARAYLQKNPVFAATEAGKALQQAIGD